MGEGDKKFYILKKIKSGITCIKEHGAKYTIRYGKKKVFDKMEQFKEVLDSKVRRKIGVVKPYVSIIVPVYNMEEYIEQAIGTLQNQSMDRIEIIVVDDGSTDCSLDILKELKKKDRRIRIFSQKNQYAGSARNLGFKYAKGEYVLFLDSDDFFDENLAMTTYEAAKKNNADIVLFGAKEFNNVTGKCQQAEWLLREDLAPKQQPFNYKDCSENLYEITTPCPWTKLFRRDFIKENNLKFQSLQNTNDLFFVYTAIAKAERIITLNEELVYYRIGLKNNLQTVKIKAPFCFYDALKAWHEKLIELNIIGTLNRSYANSALACCVHELRSAKDENIKKLIFEKLKNEIFEELDILGYEASYFNNEYNYKHMQSILYDEFEEYMGKFQ